jgi:hypothetical protein
MWLSRKQVLASIFGALALAWPGTSMAEIKLVESNGWTVTTDGRVNSFVSHIWGNDRPKGLRELAVDGVQRSRRLGCETDANHKLQRTRVRGASSRRTSRST